MSKLALITGATAGIGRATAQILAQNGYDLILTGRREGRLKELAKELKTHVQIAAFDIRKPKEIEKFVNDFDKELTKLDVLINNAGLAKGSDKFQSANLEDLDTMFETNVKGFIHLTRAVLPKMIARNSGHIVNLGSVAGRWVYPGGAVYCATKFAVRAISEGLRMDLLGKNIRVTTIEPGMVHTEFSEVRFNGDKAKADSVYAGMKPLTAADIAETIHWVLARPQHVNIQELVIYPTDQASVGMLHRS